MRLLTVTAPWRHAIDAIRRRLGSGGDRGTDRGVDRGAAVVEFVMMTLLLVLLLFAVLQLAVFMYARNVVAASAAAAARYAANVGVDDDAANGKASSLIASGLSPGAARGFSCAATESPDPDSGLRVVQVRCTGQLRMVLLPFAMPATIRVTSSALKEGSP
jgi:hypothetical protein